MNYSVFCSSLFSSHLFFQEGYKNWFGSLMFAYKSNSDPCFIVTDQPTSNPYQTTGTITVSDSSKLCIHTEASSFFICRKTCNKLWLKCADNLYHFPRVHGFCLQNARMFFLPHFLVFWSYKLMKLLRISYTCIVLFVYCVRLKCWEDTLAVYKVIITC